MRKRNMLIIIVISIILLFTIGCSSKGEELSEKLWREITREELNSYFRAESVGMDARNAKRVSDIHNIHSLFLIKIKEWEDLRKYVIWQDKNRVPNLFLDWKEVADEDYKVGILNHEALGIEDKYYTDPYLNDYVIAVVKAWDMLFQIAWTFEQWEDFRESYIKWIYEAKKDDSASLIWDYINQENFVTHKNTTNIPYVY